MSDDSSRQLIKKRWLQWREPDSKPSKDFGGPIRIVATMLLIFIVSQLIALLIVQLFAAVLNPGVNVAKTLDNSTYSEFFYVVIAEALAVGFVLLVLRSRGLSIASIGLGRKPRWADLKRGLLGFGSFYVILIIATLVLTALIPALNTGQKQNIGFESLNGPLQQAVAFFALVILPPLGEEVLVRGYLYSALRSLWKFVPAMIVTSVIFGLAHLQFGDGAPLLWAAALDTFILSIVLVYLREKTGALYAGILVHMLNNVIAFGVHFHS